MDRELRDAAKRLSSALSLAMAEGAVDPDHVCTEAVVEAGQEVLEALNRGIAPPPPMFPIRATTGPDDTMPLPDQIDWLPGVSHPYWWRNERLPRLLERIEESGGSPLDRQRIVALVRQLQERAAGRDKPRTPNAAEVNRATAERMLAEERYQLSRIAGSKIGWSEEPVPMIAERERRIAFLEDLLHAW